VDSDVKTLGEIKWKNIARDRQNPAESSKESYGSQRAVWPMMMMIMVAKPLRLEKLHLRQMNDGSLCKYFR
jgi:hypothetical protein